MIKIAVRIFGILVVFAIPVLAWASPHNAICMASKFVGNEISSGGNVQVSKSATQSDINKLNDYVMLGRERIKTVLWDQSSTPEILFLNGEKVFGLLEYNNYGSSISLPHKTCLLIGPKGLNIDVISHELVHADIAMMLGFWKNLNLPAWINEGIAMQVDMRKRYDISTLDGADVKYVTSKNGREFYKDDVDQVVRNYAAARHLFSEWIDANDVDRLSTELLLNNYDSFGLH